MSVITASAVTGRERRDRVLDAIIVVDEGSQGSLSLEKGVRNNYLGDLLLVKTTRPSENASESETDECLTILSENSWSARKVPEQLVKKKKKELQHSWENETLRTARPQI